ncbi:MAG: hypothetical protein H6619_01060 [Deltaproteobacteria bacterium]|nr:hypothetical protein [Deltaproteobacteria bacterium]
MKKLIAPLLLLVIGCGGSSTSSESVSLVDESVTIRASLTDNKSSYAPGDLVSYMVETTNFTLAVPFNLRTESAHDTETNHLSDELNPDANEGHYHVYLDDADGTDHHLTSWQIDDSYQLPAELESGTHTLRFELRDNNHVKVGPEDVVFFDVK